MAAKDKREKDGGHSTACIAIGWFLVCNVSSHSLSRATPPTMTETSHHQIGISVETEYLPEQSSPDNNQFTFAYTITISNKGKVAAQLISRHWIITDAENKVQEVRGLGVIGEQPLLKPGESFHYTSGCQLETPVGTMQGSYQMVAEDGSKFDAEIPLFVLSMPRVLH